MTALPEGNAGKALALGVCLVLLAIFHLVAVQPLIGLYQDGQQRLDEQRELVARLQRTVGSLPDLRTAAAKGAQEKSSVAELLLPGASDAVAAASLQSTVKKLVSDGGATLSSAEILPARTDDNLRRIGLRATFSGDLHALTTFLRGIETAHPLLYVDNLEIRGGGGEARSAPLAIVFEVYGFPAH